MTTNNESLDLHAPAGTPLSKFFSCCFPKPPPSKNKSRSINFAEPKLEYEDPDKSESGMVYFDLPDVDDDDDDTANSKLTAPHLVTEFWRFLFSLFLFEWLRKKEQQQKRIKNE